MHVYLTLESYLDLLLSAFAGAVSATHTYILYIYKMMCSYVDSLASTGFAYSMLNRKYELWYVDENLLCSVFVSQRECVCVCLCMCFTLLLKSRREMLQMCCTFIPESSFEVRGSHGNLTFHCGLPLIKIELSVFSLNPHSIFFFNRDERFCLRCPGSCVPCCLVISEINSSTSPSCA